MIKTYLLRGLLLIVVLILILLIANWRIVKRAYLFATLTKKNKIVWNFSNMEKMFPHQVLSKSPTPFLFPKRDTIFELPKTFESQGKIYDINEFMDSTFTKGILMLQDGKIAYENYWRGMTDSTTNISFSVSKSYVSALVGIAIKEGYIDSEQDLITKYLPQFKGTGYDDVTIEHCMEMASGVKFIESYDHPDSDVASFSKQLLFNKSLEDYMLKIKSDRKPGTYKNYQSLDAQIVAMVVRTATGSNTLSEYMQKKLCHPLGMEHDAHWLIEGGGMELALAGLNISLRDYAKFGQLYLQKGQWQGQEIIPADYVIKSITPTKLHQMPGYDNPFSNRPYGYGYFWCTPIIDKGDGVFFATGLHHQLVYVNPIKKVVVVTATANPYYAKDQLMWKERYLDFVRTLVDKI